MKCLRASGRLAMARRNGFGCLALLSRLARNSFAAGSTLRIVVAIGTSINAADKFPVAFHEIQAVEFALGVPAQVVKDQVLRLAGELANPEEDELDLVFPGIGKVIAGHELARGARDAEFLLQFARQRLFRALAGLHLAAGELPLQRMRLLGHALSHQRAQGMPISSPGPRASACSGLSPGSTLPPGNSHFSGCDCWGMRCPTRILSPLWRTAATTCTMSTLEHRRL